mmetsp:Transcript_35865/g.100919  ORF Transcript_35865/g.100919 Transcript_35865/m.100919 type:complete len:292 (+) Transcript_35865:533-1408(+)
MLGDAVQALRRLRPPRPQPGLQEGGGGVHLEDAPVRPEARAHRVVALRAGRPRGEPHVQREVVGQEAVLGRRDQPRPRYRVELPLLVVAPARDLYGGGVLEVAVYAEAQERDADADAVVGSELRPEEVVVDNAQDGDFCVAGHGLRQRARGREEPDPAEVRHHGKGAGDRDEAEPLGQPPGAGVLDHLLDLRPFCCHGDGREDEERRDGLEHDEHHDAVGPRLLELAHVHDAAVEGGVQGGGDDGRHGEAEAEKLEIGTAPTCDGNSRDEHRGRHVELELVDPSFQDSAED